MTQELYETVGLDAGESRLFCPEEMEDIEMLDFNV